MTLRIDVKDLGDEICASLARGEAVAIERDGEVVARIAAATSDADAGKTTPWAQFLELRRLHGPVDDDFERDLAEARRLLNGLVVTEPWE